MCVRFSAWKILQAGAVKGLMSSLTARQVVAGKLMEQGPVLVISFHAQQIMAVRDMKGNIVEGDMVRDSCNWLRQGPCPLGGSNSNSYTMLYHVKKLRAHGAVHYEHQHDNKLKKYIKRISTVNVYINTEAFHTQPLTI